MTSADEYDILSQFGNSEKADRDFNVAFDYYTPRAHFSIHSKIKGKWRDITNMDEDTQQRVFKVALNITELCHLDPSCLTFHRGSWITTRDNFHCHVCCEVNPYLSMFNDLRSRRPMSYWWTNDNAKQFITKQWKVKRPEDLSGRYIANVKNYPHGSWKSEEIREIKSIMRNRHTDGPSEFSGLRVVYHRYKRQIGLAGEVPRNAEGLHQLFLILDQFQRKIGTTLALEKFGCHVCVDMTGKGFSEFDCSEKVLGYVLVPGHVMYAMCPDRDNWFTRYSDPSFDDKIYT